MHAIEPLRHYQGRKADIQMFIFGFIQSPISDFLFRSFGPYNAGMNGKTGRRDLCVKTNMIWPRFAKGMTAAAARSIPLLCGNFLSESLGLFPISFPISWSIFYSGFPISDSSPIPISWLSDFLFPDFPFPISCSFPISWFLKWSPMKNGHTEHLVAGRLEEFLSHAIEPLRHYQGR